MQAQPEPIYEYEKGRGWILTPSVPWMDCQSYEGRNIRIYARPPKQDEYYLCKRWDRGYDNGNGQASLEVFASYAADRHSDDYNYRDDATANDEEWCYITIEFI